MTYHQLASLPSVRDWGRWHTGVLHSSILLANYHRQFYTLCAHLIITDSSIHSAQLIITDSSIHSAQLIITDSSIHSAQLIITYSSIHSAQLNITDSSIHSAQLITTDSSIHSAQLMFSLYLFDVCILRHQDLPFYSFDTACSCQPLPLQQNPGHSYSAERKDRGLTTRKPLSCHHSQLVIIYYAGVFTSRVQILRLLLTVIVDKNPDWARNQSKLNMTQ